MRIIYLEGFGTEDRLAYKDDIASNIFTSMRVLLKGAKKFGIPLTEESQAVAEFFLESENSFFTQPITPSVAADLKLLWKDRGIQAVFERRSELQLYDSTT